MDDHSSNGRGDDSRADGLGDDRSSSGPRDDPLSGDRGDEAPLGGSGIESTTDDHGGVAPSSRSRFGGASTGDTLINALIGAVVTVLLSFTGFSPVLGGAVAGYLEGRDGVKVGAISGLIAVIPLFLLGFLFITFVGLFAVDAAAFFLFFGLIAFAFLLALTVGLSALGGFLGVYLAEEYEL